jgi:hypothetical protein
LKSVSCRTLPGKLTANLISVRSCEQWYLIVVIIVVNPFIIEIFEFNLRIQLSHILKLFLLRFKDN